MKRLFFVLIFTLSLSTVHSQSERIKEMIKEIEGQWSLDENNLITYVKVINFPDLSKDEIYTKAINYFTYNYGSGKSVIQSQDKEKGIIVGKGIYSNVHYIKKAFFGHESWSVWHILRIDIKDNKARLILTLTDYEVQFDGYTIGPIPIVETYPFKKEFPQINKYGEAFYKTHKYALNELENIEHKIKEGNTSKKYEDNNW